MRYFGDPIAIVAAETAAQARAAVQAVKGDYDALPTMMTPAEALGEVTFRASPSRSPSLLASRIWICAMGRGNSRSREGHLPGVHHNQLCPFSHSAEHTMRDKGMGFCGIGPDHKNAIGIFNLRDRIRHGSASEGSGKTCHCGCVSEPCAVIDVVCSEPCPAKLLKKMIFLDDISLPDMLWGRCCRARWPMPKSPILTPQGRKDSWVSRPS